MNGSTTPAARGARRSHASALGVTVPPRVLFLLFRGSPSHDPFALSPRDSIVIARGGRACPRFTTRAVRAIPRSLRCAGSPRHSRWRCDRVE